MSHNYVYTYIYIYIYRYASLCTHPFEVAFLDLLLGPTRWFQGAIFKRGPFDMWRQRKDRSPQFKVRRFFFFLFFCLFLPEKASARPFSSQTFVR